jgi:phosphoglycerol transferase MdoB-like AlkP superfamily enzyme
VKNKSYFLSESLSNYALEIKRLFIFTLVNICGLALSRLYFYLNNEAYFSDLSFKELCVNFFYASRIDINVIYYSSVLFLLLNLTYLFYKTKILKFFFATTLSFVYTLTIADSDFFSIFGTRGNLNFFASAQGASLSQSLNAMTPFLHLLVVFIVLIFIHYWLISRIFNRYIPNTIPFKIISFLSFAAILVIGVRGGFQHEVLGTPHLGYFSNGKTEANTLVANPVFTIIRGKNKDSLPLFFTDESHSEEYFATETKKRTPLFKSSLEQKIQAKNVLIFYIESLTSYALDKVKSEGYEIVFPTSSEEELYESDLYANGTISMDSLSAMYFGVPSFFDIKLFKSVYSSNKWLGFPTILTEQKGFNTFFVHGAEKGTQFFGSISRAGGIKDFYPLRDLVSLEDDPGNFWGVHDETLYSEGIKIVDSFAKKEKPFLGIFFSTSTHVNFQPPPGYTDAGNMEDNYFNTVRYSVEHVSKMLESIKDKPWFDDTLIIVTADHSPPLVSDWVQQPEERSRLPFYAFLKNSNIKNLVKKNYIQQVDLAPSLFHLFDVKVKEWSPFGSSIFENSEDNDYIYTTDTSLIQSKDGCIFSYPYIKDMNDKVLSFENEACKININDKNSVFSRVREYSLGLKNNSFYKELGSD